MSKKSHRKRYSRTTHTNIMLDRKLKSLLDDFKVIIREKQNKEFNPSYNDVIIYLVIQFLKKELYFMTKSFSFNFPIKQTSFVTETKSFSLNFENL